MSQVQVGDTVRVHYVGMLEDGTFIGNSRKEYPLVFTVGQGTVIPGLERAVIGMQPGMVNIARIPCDLAFGPYQDDLVTEVDPRGLTIEDILQYLGHEVDSSVPKDEMAPLVMTWMQDDLVHLDANHPLAGENLIFEIEMLEIIQRTDGDHGEGADAVTYPTRDGLESSPLPLLVAGLLSPSNCGTKPCPSPEIT